MSENKHFSPASNYFFKMHIFAFRSKKVILVSILPSALQYVSSEIDRWNTYSYILESSKLIQIRGINPLEVRQEFLWGDRSRWCYHIDRHIFLFNSYVLAASNPNLFFPRFPAFPNRPFDKDKWSCMFVSLLIQARTGRINI